MHNMYAYYEYERSIILYSLVCIGVCVHLMYCTVDIKYHTK